MAHLQSEQEGRRLMQYLAQLKPNKSVSATLRIAGGRSSRSGYFRFLHNVINSMASLSAVPEKRVVRYISVQLCAFWNCGLSYAKSHDNKLIHLISFEGTNYTFFLHRTLF